MNSRVEVSGNRIQTGDTKGSVNTPSAVGETRAAAPGAATDRPGAAAGEAGPQDVATRAEMRAVRVTSVRLVSGSCSPQ